MNAVERDAGDASDAVLVIGAVTISQWNVSVRPVSDIAVAVSVAVVSGRDDVSGGHVTSTSGSACTCVSHSARPPAESVATTWIVQSPF